jgi:phage terminase Nu1 subunit (DNA packaging protein)
MEVSKARFCDIMGWSTYEFDQQVRDGLPLTHLPVDRQGEYLLHAGTAIRWLIKRALEQAGHPGAAETLDYNGTVRLARGRLPAG